MFLSEVALGKMDSSPSGGKPSKGCDSVYAKGSIDPTGSLVTIKEGIRIPCPPVVNEQADWGESEYIVFNPAQIHIRYLVLLKTKGWTNVPLEKLIEADEKIRKAARGSGGEEEEEEDLDC